MDPVKFTKKSQSTEGEITAIQVFEPDANAVYSIETVAHLTHLPRHEIGVYCKEGLVSPAVDPECGGYYFDDEAIRTLRQIEHLRTNYGVSLPGVTMILGLMNEVEHLRDEVRFLRG
ncbi:MAG: MerR family transcriptional regulator [Limisphaerales bacterium]